MCKFWIHTLRHISDAVHIVHLSWKSSSSTHYVPHIKGIQSLCSGEFKHHTFIEKASYWKERIKRVRRGCYGNISPHVCLRGGFGICAMLLGPFFAFVQPHSTINTPTSSAAFYMSILYTHVRIGYNCVYWKDGHLKMTYSDFTIAYNENGFNFRIELFE